MHHDQAPVNLMTLSQFVVLLNLNHPRARITSIERNSTEMLVLVYTRLLYWQALEVFSLWQTGAGGSVRLRLMLTAVCWVPSNKLYMVCIVRDA